MISAEVKVVIVGSGGREAVFADFCGNSPFVREVIVAPGNVGTIDLARKHLKPIYNVDLPHGDVAGIIDIARRHKTSLVVAGSEAWLDKELGDVLLEEGIPA